jgi:hypothetical protein
VGWGGRGLAGGLAVARARPRRARRGEGARGRAGRARVRGAGALDAPTPPLHASPSGRMAGALVSNLSQLVATLTVLVWGARAALGV